MELSWKMLFKRKIGHWQNHKDSEYFAKIFLLLTGDVIVLVTDATFQNLQ
jgi:hypothetical protein